jgi:hypothetical protein
VLMYVYDKDILTSLATKMQSIMLLRTEEIFYVLKESFVIVLNREVINLSVCCMFDIILFTV